MSFSGRGGLFSARRTASSRLRITPASACCCCRACLGCCAMAKSKKRNRVASSVGTASGSGQARGVGVFQVHTPLPPDHELNTLIGQVASGWAYVEHILDGIIWELVGVEPSYGACITAQVMGIGNRCRILLALAELKHLDKSIVDRITELMRRSYDTGELRNRIVHNPWFLEHQSKTATQFKSMPWSERSYGMKTKDKKYLDTVLAKIGRRTQEAARIRAEVTIWLASSRDK